MGASVEERAEGVQENVPGVQERGYIFLLSYVA